MRLIFLLGIMIFLGFGSAAEPGPEPREGQAGEVLPPFPEVYQLLRERLPQMTDTELNRAAVMGVIEKLHPQAILLPEKVDHQEEGTADLLSQATLYEEDVAYIRVARVETGLSQALRSAHQQLKSEQPIRGLVLDLRFARGRDYRAAAEVADLFLDWETVLLRWNDMVARSSAKKDPISGPVAVLVNGQTAAAAEVLAAVLRQNQIGLIIGAPTAGEAHQYEEFTLSTGQRLQVATRPVDVGDRSGLSAQGLTPDIAVRVSLEEERQFLKDPYRRLTGEGQQSRARMTHAEMVRRRNVPDPDRDSQTPPEATPEEPVLQDPVLARGVDLVKGLAVLQRGR